MSASREKLGLKLLRALKREKDRSKTLLDCRTLPEVSSELRFSESEQAAAFGFLVEKQAIDSIIRPDGRRAALPSPQGESLLATEKDKTTWTHDRRLTLLTIIIALLGILVTALVARCGLQ